MVGCREASGAGGHLKGGGCGWTQAWAGHEHGQAASVGKTGVRWWERYR